MKTWQNLTLGVVHILRLQDEVGKWSKNCPLFFNIQTIENVNTGGVGVQKSQNTVNVVCEPPLSTFVFDIGKIVTLLATFDFC
jgi:hypothetical protein